MDLVLEKVNGQPAHLPVELRRCGPEDLDAMEQLQREVHAGMPHPEQFVPDTRDQLAACMADGVCVGVWDGETLGAYFTLRCMGSSPENYAAFMGLPPAEWPRWANADSAVVCAAWRGNGLQRIMARAVCGWLPEGIVGLGATVSPDNAYSLRNALAEGFEIVCRRPMYGGFDRYLLRKIL